MRSAAFARTLAFFALPALFAAPAAAQAPAPTVRIVEDREAGDMVIEVGPVDLPAGMGHLQLPALQAAIPVDGWLHGYRIEVVDGQGRPVPQRVLHHVNVISPQRRELFSQIMLRVAAAGQETGPNMLPRLMGYRVRPGQRLIVTAMLNNPGDQAYDDAVLRVRFPYTRRGGLVKPISVFPFYMDVMPPAGLHSYDLPPGHSVKTWEARPAVDGRIIGVGGHLHKYGVALRLEDVTARKVIWEGKPEVDETGEVTGMPTKKFIWSLGVPVRANHVYRLSAVYQNPTGQMIPDGGMGALGGVFIPSDSDKWPAIDRSHEELRRDWWFVHNGNQEMDGTGGHGHGSHGAHGQAGHGAAPAAAAQGHAHGKGETKPAGHNH